MSICKGCKKEAQVNESGLCTKCVENENRNRATACAQMVRNDEEEEKQEQSPNEQDGQITTNGDKKIQHSEVIPSAKKSSTPHKDEFLRNITTSEPDPQPTDDDLDYK